MIRNFERYHGPVLVRLIRSFPNGVHVRPYVGANGVSTGPSYVVESKLGLYIKYSRKRMSPWGFSFKPEHLHEIAEMCGRLPGVLLLLVCGDDGVVALEGSTDFESVIRDVKTESKWVRVSRGRKGLYSVTGSDGELPFKVSRTALVEKASLMLGVPVQALPVTEE